MHNHRYNPIDITIPLFIIMGISEMVIGNYLAGSISLIIALGQFIVPRVGVDNLNRLDRFEVLFVWVMGVTLACLIIYQVYRDFVS